jgi:hypothetical protein
MLSVTVNLTKLSVNLTLSVPFMGLRPSPLLQARKGTLLTDVLFCFYAFFIFITRKYRITRNYREYKKKMEKR